VAFLLCVSCDILKSEVLERSFLFGPWNSNALYLVVPPSTYEPSRCVGEVYIATWTKWFVSRAIRLLTFDILWKHIDEFDVLWKHIDDRKGGEK
jgi:hypothetical protein